MNTPENGTESCLDVEFTAILRAGQVQDVICRFFMTSRAVLPWKKHKIPHDRHETKLLSVRAVPGGFHSLAGTERKKGKACVEVMKATIAHVLVSLSRLCE